MRRRLIQAVALVLIVAGGYVAVPVAVAGRGGCGGSQKESWGAPKACEEEAM